jgi:hypothetical protein
VPQHGSRLLAGKEIVPRRYVALRSANSICMSLQSVPQIGIIRTEDNLARRVAPPPWVSFEVQDEMCCRPKPSPCGVSHWPSAKHALS